MAMAAQTIVAEKLTLTGSIGVVTGEPSELILCGTKSSNEFSTDTAEFLVLDLHFDHWIYYVVPDMEYQGGGG